MNRITFLVAVMMFTSTGIEAQNPYKYETVVEIIEPTRQTVGLQTKTISNLDKIQSLSDNYNSRGYKLIQMNTVTDVTPKLVLVFERSSSYREAELHKLINELTTRIDTTSKKYTDTAMGVIQVNVLNYLKSIPNDVITQEYKDQLTKLIINEAEDKVKKLIEELKKEIRNQSNN